VIAFQNEIDRENNAHDDVEELARPVPDREQQIGGCLAGEILKTGTDIRGIQMLAKGMLFSFSTGPGSRVGISWANSCKSRITGGRARNPKAATPPPLPAAGEKSLTP
jgi:hypothetical protein